MKKKIKKLRRAKYNEIVEFIKENLIKDKCRITASLHQRAILKDIYPFSWGVYCKKKGLKTDILMDDHEKAVRRNRRKNGKRK